MAFKYLTNRTKNQSQKPDLKFTFANKYVLQVNKLAKTGSILLTTNNDILCFMNMNDTTSNSIKLKGKISQVCSIDNIITCSAQSLEILDSEEIIYSFPFKFDDHKLFPTAVHGLETNIKICDLRIGACTSTVGVGYHANSFDSTESIIATGGDLVRLWDLRFILEKRPIVEIDLPACNLSLSKDATKVFIKNKRFYEYDLLTGTMIEIPGLPVEQNYIAEHKDISVYNNFWQLQYKLNGHLDNIDGIFIADDEIYSWAKDGVIQWQPSWLSEEIPEDSWD